MKKLLYAAGGILLTSFFVFATITFAADPSVTPTPAEKNNYLLAYPGMLPDSPFYKLKVLRDKILTFLITDPKKKIDYYLLLTDKQIGMVKMLVDKNEVSLAKTTALKAENNFTELVFVYRNNGLKPESATYSKLEKAALKHQEVLGASIKKVNLSDAKTFQQVIDYSNTNLQSLDQIYNRKK